MTLEEALYYHLVNTAGVAALISTRLYPNVVPEDVVQPSAAYQVISRLPILHHAGPSGLETVRIQITCRATTYAVAKSLAVAIKAALDGFSGAMGGVGGVTVEYSHVENEQDGYNMVSGSSTMRLDVIVMYQPGNDLFDYLLRDEFITNLNAGAVNNTLAEPGPGTRRVTDTGAILSLSNGYIALASAAGGAWNDLDIYYTPGREIGAVMFEYMQSGFSGEVGMLISPTDRPASPTTTGSGVYHNLEHLYNIPDWAGTDKLKITKTGKPLRAILYYIYVIRRPTAGAWIIVSGGIYGAGTLLWVSDTDDISSTTYLGIPLHTGGIHLDGFQAVEFNKLSAPFRTDYGPALDYDTFTRGDNTNIGTTEGGARTWVEIGNGVAISSNTLIPSAAQGGAIVNLGQQPRIIGWDITVPVGGGINVRIYFRCASTGNFNDTCAFVTYGTDAAYYENGVDKTVGAGTYGKLVAGQVNPIRIIDWGDRVTVWVNGLLAMDYATTFNVDASHYYTGIFVFTTAAGFAADNFQAYAVSITPPSIFTAIPVAAVGSGAAIFTDTFTDTDGVVLSTHNVLWSTSGAGSWEINTNKARMTADGVTGYAVVDAGVVDHEIEFTVTTPNTEPASGADEWYCGGMVRWTDVNNFVLVRMLYTSSGEIEITQTIGGTGVVIKFNSNMAWVKATAYTFKIAAKGSDLCVYLAGELVMQVRVSLLTGTKCGIGTNAIGGAGNRPTWDNVTVKET
jgi:hypothetical protein